MNALEVSSPKHGAQPTNDGALFDLDFFIKKEDEKVDSPETSEDKVNDDAMVDITPNTIDNSSNIKDSPLDNILDLGLPLVNNDIESTVTKTEVTPEPKEITKSNKYSEVKPLNDINVTLQSIRPSKVPPLTVFEEEGGLTVVLHFCRDKPRPDVNVIVISTTSKNPSPIEEYKFQAVLPKVSSIHLYLILVN